MMRLMTLMCDTVRQMFHRTFWTLPCSCPSDFFRLMSDVEKEDGVLTRTACFHLLRFHLDRLHPTCHPSLPDFFRLMSEVENEDLVFTLEVLVRKLDEEMAPYALGLIQNLVSAADDPMCASGCCGSAEMVESFLLRSAS